MHTKYLSATIPLFQMSLQALLLLVVVAIPGMTTESAVTLSNTGDVPLRFCASDVAASPCLEGGIILSPGDSTAVQINSLSLPGVTPTFLNVSHNVSVSPSPDGLFTVVLVS